jgi:hypothetical protein
MSLLPEEDWKTLITTAIGLPDLVAAHWDEVWKLSAGMDTMDPSGELRRLDVTERFLELALGPTSLLVAGSDGGGQSGNWDQHFEHLTKMREVNKAAITAKMTALMVNASMDGGNTVMEVTSLTPVYPGYVNPGHPALSGDPRWKSTTP